MTETTQRIKADIETIIAHAKPEDGGAPVEPFARLLGQFVLDAHRIANALETMVSMEVDAIQERQRERDGKKA